MNTYNGCLSVSSITGRMPKIMFECTVILNLNFLGHSKKKPLNFGRNASQYYVEIKVAYKVQAYVRERFCKYLIRISISLC